MSPLAELIQKNIEFLDIWFEEKLAREGKSRLVELLVCDYLNHWDLVFFPWQKGGRTWPDFLLEKEVVKIWVECYRPDIKPFWQQNLANYNDNQNRIATQITSWIVREEWKEWKEWEKSKKEKYNRDVKSWLIQKNDYFIFAIFIDNLTYPRETNWFDEEKFGSWIRFAFLGETYFCIDLKSSKPFLQTKTPPKNKNQKHIDGAFFEKNSWLDGILYFSGCEEKAVSWEKLKIGFLENPYSGKNTEILKNYFQIHNEEMILL